MFDPNTTQVAQIPNSVPVGADGFPESQQQASLIKVPQHTVLYVEDNPVNLQLVAQIFELRPDLQLLKAADGHLGIELARLHKPDVILMDLNLPVISGFDAMRILQAEPTTAAIPIIAFSANAIPGDFKKGHTGFFDYISKPIRINVFLEALDAALEFANSSSPLVAK